MVDVVLILLAASLILFFGLFSEFIFKKVGIPDVLLLLILGFLLGPTVFGYIQPESIVILAPIFTTFTLLFLLFDGAFNINLSSLVREFSQSFVLTVFNFLVSTLIVSIVMTIAGFSILISLLTGFLLGGVSSAFVIPVLKQMNIKPTLYSLLTLESALTDVFCIVFSLTVIEIMRLGSFGVKAIFTQLASQFAVAGLIGLVGGVIWIVLIIKVFKEHNYMMTIAYLMLIYVITQFLSGNGAIAALFFGLILKNSKQLTSILEGIKRHKETKKLKTGVGVNVTTPSEQQFYHQISFFLKTFFFVYIGVLIDISDTKALIIGGLLSVLLAGSRMASLLLTKKMETSSRSIVNSMFARGLAAAAIVQTAIQLGVPNAEFLAKVTYVVIAGTILLSSIKVFIARRTYIFDTTTTPLKKGGAS
jgi:potassium/hydrogen antiporter